MNTNEDSSLHALRELRELEKRRFRQEDEERRVREEIERQAVEARERAESSRLGRELESARAEIAHLRGELETTCLAQAAVSVTAPQASRLGRSAGWLGIMAGTTMLVGALALAAATGPKDRHRPSSLAEIPERSSPACPATGGLVPADVEPPPTPPGAGIEPAVPRHTPKPRPPASARPHGTTRPTSGAICDGTDPLCGIDPKVIDDVGKKSRKR